MAFGFSIRMNVGNDINFEVLVFSSLDSLDLVSENDLMIPIFMVYGKEGKDLIIAFSLCELYTHPGFYDHDATGKFSHAAF